MEVFFWLSIVIPSVDNTIIYICANKYVFLYIVLSLCDKHSKVNYVYSIKHLQTTEFRPI